LSRESCSLAFLIFGFLTIHINDFTYKAVGKLMRITNEQVTLEFRFGWIQTFLVAT